MKTTLKKIALTVVLTLFTTANFAQMTKADVEFACSKITFKTHSHFNLVHNNNVDKHEMKSDFSLEFKENVMIIHNGLNEIHIAYKTILYLSTGKPDKAGGEMKGQWYIIF